jgi:predicted ATP-dependent endonuclease of OLD family
LNESTNRGDGIASDPVQSHWNAGFRPAAIFTGHVSSVIRNLILDTKENAPQRYDRLKNRLEKDFDFHLDKVLFDEKEDLYVTAQYSEVCDNSTLSLDFSASGSGFMQILQILAPIYRFCPDAAEVVLLDEPDAHLHPNLQTSLATSLRKIQQELNIQIIISTHSTSIIRAAFMLEQAQMLRRRLKSNCHREQQ